MAIGYRLIKLIEQQFFTGLLSFLCTVTTFALFPYSDDCSKILKVY